MRTTTRQRRPWPAFLVGLCLTAPVAYAETAGPVTAPAATSTGVQGAGAAAAPAPADKPLSPAEDLFARKCGSCHTVGKGIRVGPDLKDAHKRRSRTWLESFVKAPSTMLDSDPDARNLLADFNGVRMPDLGLPPEDVKALVDLVTRCSTEPCNLAGKFTPALSATARDIARGRELFLGLAPLKSGGVPCASCHTVRGVGSIVPGGTLAKDLTNVFARLGDEGLDNALANPAFPLMNKVFTDHPLDATEVFALRAFLYQANRGGEPACENKLSVSLMGSLGAFGVLISLNAAWGRRLRGVRRPLVSKRSGGQNRGHDGGHKK